MNRPLTGLLAAAALSAGLTATCIQTEDAPGKPAAPATADAAKPPGVTQGPAERKEFTKEEIKAALVQCAANAAKKGNPGAVQMQFGGQPW